MIIVKTSKGDSFLNEKICTSVVHDKTEQKVHVLHNEQPYIIENVESVRYISDAQAVDYTEEGSEIEKTEISGFRI